MRILVLNADYPRFLTWFYRREPGLENASYAAQMAARNASLFGLADFYSRSFAAIGHTAAEIHVNNPRLQAAWARERGMAASKPPGVGAGNAAPAWLQRIVTPFKSMHHQERIALLEAVARRYDLKIWAVRPQTLPASSPLHRCFQGEAWGAEMYQVLRRSRITFNSHIDLAGREAGNMRLFEATGVGAFLLTDFKDNLETLFAPDREVAVWRSIDDCLKIIDRHLRDDKRRAEIGRAGQARTMAQHTYRHRTSEILGFIDGMRARR